MSETTRHSFIQEEKEKEEKREWMDGSMDMKGTKKEKKKTRWYKGSQDRRINRRKGNISKKWWTGGKKKNERSPVRFGFPTPLFLTSDHFANTQTQLTIEKTASSPTDSQT